MQGATGPGGAWEGLKDIVFGLERERFEPVLVCSEAPSWLGSSDKVETVVIEMPLLREDESFSRTPLAVGRLREVIRSRGISLVHANNVWDAPYAIMAAKPLSIPIVVHVRTRIDREKAKKYSLDEADVVASTSRAAVQVLWGFEPLTGRVFYLPNGIDLSRFNPEQSGEETRRKHGIGSEAVVFGAVGRIDRLKGLDILVSAFARVADGAEPARLLIVGEGKGSSFKEDLVEMIEKLHLSKRVVFAGHQDDPASYLAAIDVLVMPSRTEGFGRSAVEAMAMAKPVIASDIGTLPEIVMDGLTGCVFPNGDVDALADKMNELAASQRKRKTLGRTGRSLAEGRFDLKIMISRLQSIYGVLLAGSVRE